MTVSSATHGCRGPFAWCKLTTVTIVCLVAALLVGGCASGRAMDLKTEAQFDAAISGPQPALVMFYKQGCATCAPLEGTFDHLAEEYEGRAVVGKFAVLTFVFGVPSRRIKEQYDISFVPTAILFVDGQPAGRWFMDYSINHYREALNQYVPPAMEEESSGG